MRNITKHVVEGEILHPLSSLKIQITIDPAVMRRATDAVDQAKRAMAGMAVPLARQLRPDERNIIDQD